jgi:chorismate mutase
MSKVPSKAPPAPLSLQELRKEIDAIDEQVHRLLMARGDIIDRLIQVKQTQEVGSAFRPAREASMMRGLVQRHRGILPLDTIESIWRVIISTFTYVQAPFAVHADVSVGEPAMRDSARFHFGFVVPYVGHFSAQAAVEAVAKSKGDLALVSAISSRKPWWIALEADGAPKINARLPFLERADHPAALPVFVISRVADDAMVTEVRMWSVRVSGWNADIARAVAPLAEIVAVSDTAFDGAALLVSDAGTGFEKIKKALIQAGASVRSSALVGGHATRYTVPPERGSQVLKPPSLKPRLEYSEPEDEPPRAESRHSRYCALHARQDPGAGAGAQGVQAVRQRDPVRAVAEGQGSLSAGGFASGGLSGRHLAGAARGDRPRLRARSQPYHLRRRLGRNPQSPGAHLSEPWR